MVKVINDLTGMQFGLLTVVRQTEDYISPSGKHMARWLCKCSCKEQKEVEVVGGSLKSGSTQSCGCLQKERVAQSNSTKHNYKKYNNEFDLSGEYGVLWLNGIGTEKILFDLEDAEIIMKHQWCLDGDKYVATRIGKKLYRMHQLLGYANHDHKNKNKFDNRKDNLRPATHQENCRNRPLSTKNTSSVIGVGRMRDKWYARIWIDGKLKHLGVFNDKEDAIKVRLTSEAECFGEFAPQIDLFQKYNISFGSKECNVEED